MNRIDPVWAFVLALIVWAVVLASLLSSGCGGAQRRCADAVAVQKGGEPRCTEVPR